MRKYGAQTAFLDLLFLSLLGFVALTLLELLLINPIEQNKKIDARAEFMITVTWPDEMFHDVDTWVEDPVGNVVSFRQREKGLMHLDRDDLGRRNDSIVTAYGIVEFKGNREIVTIRGIVPGEYVVNVHMYRKEGHEQNDPNLLSDGSDYDSSSMTPVTINLDKISPFRTITIKTVVLVETGDEKTAFRFVVDRDGQVTDVNELPKFVAQPHLNGTNTAAVDPSGFFPDIDPIQPEEEEEE